MDALFRIGAWLTDDSVTILVRALIEGHERGPRLQLCGWHIHTVAAEEKVVRGTPNRFVIVEEDSNERGITAGHLREGFRRNNEARSRASENETLSTASQLC